VGGTAENSRVISMTRTSSATVLVDCRCTLGEGIVWSADRRSLLWTDIEGSTLWTHRIDDNVTERWPLPDRLGCFAICESGRLLLGLAKTLAFADLVKPDDGSLRVEPVLPIDPGFSRNRINDGRTDRAGNFVFGTMNELQDAPAGSFYQYSSAHGLRRLDVGGVVIPNSICFSPNGRTMYFCDSPDARILQCDYDADAARVGNVRDFVRLEKGSGLPDGSIVDRDGCLWNAVWGAGVVRQYDPSGRLLSQIPVPSKNLTCVAFGGESLDELFVTSSRQEMSEEELAATPSSGSVYRVPTASRGISDALFRD
jgi:sugar lactone lactonase YvrE